MESAPPPARPASRPAARGNLRRRRALILFWIAILGLAFFALDAWIAGFEPWLAQRLAREVGRPVRIAGLGYRPFFGARLARIEIENLGAAEGVAFDLAAGRLLAGELRLDGIEIDSSSMSLARGPDGRWNFEGLFPRADPSAPPAFARARVARFTVAVETEATYRGTVEVAPAPEGRFDVAGSGDLVARGFTSRIEARVRAGSAAGAGSFKISADTPTLRATIEVSVDTQIRVAGPVSLCWTDGGRSAALDLHLHARSEGSRIAVLGDGRVRVEPFAGTQTSSGEGRLEIDALLDPAELRCELRRAQFAAPFGRIEARGRIDSAALDLVVGLREASVRDVLTLAQRLGRASAVSPGDCSGVLRGEVRVQGALRAPRIALAKVEIPRATLGSPNATAEIRDGKVSLVGDFRGDSWRDSRWTVTATGVAGLRIFSETASRWVPALGEADVSARVSFADPTRDPTRMRIDSLHLADGDLLLDAQGEATDSGLALDVALRRARLEDLAGLFDLLPAGNPVEGVRMRGGVQDGAFRLEGPWSSPALVSGSWRIPEGRFEREGLWARVRDASYRIESAPRIVTTTSRVSIGRDTVSYLDDASLHARFEIDGGGFRVDSFVLAHPQVRARARGDWGDAIDLRVEISRLEIAPAISVARAMAPVPPALDGTGAAEGSIRIRRSSASESIQADGELRLDRATLRLSEAPSILLEGVTGRVPISLRPRGGGETVAARARTDSTNLVVARLAAGPIEISGARLAASLDGRELRVENGSFELAHGRGEIAGIVSFREGRDIRTALLGRVRGLQMSEVYDRIQPFEGELTGRADAEFQFAMEGARVVNLHAPIRARSGGKIGARLLREFAEKLENGSVKMGMMGLSQFSYRNFRVDLDLARDYYSRETARAKFDPPLSETIRDEILMEVGFDGPMPVWGPIHIDVDLKVVGMQLNLLLERVRRNRGATASPANASGAAETPPASEDAPRSAPAPPR